MRVEHISAVSAIEKLSFPQPWPQNAYRREIMENRMAHYVVARRLTTLPVVVRASGPGLLFEPVFERRAQELGIDVVGSRPRSAMPLLLRPVLRFLAA